MFKKTKNNKLIVGLYSWHDGGYAILENGKIIEHIEIERHNRQKESGGDSFRYFCDLFLKKRNISLEHALDNFDFVAPMPTSSLEKDGSNYFNIHKTLPKDKIKFYSHHLCHAAHAFYSSPFNKAYSITIDNAGMDDDEKSVSCTVYACENNEMKRIFEIPTYKISMGEIWGKFTRFVFKLSAGRPRGNQAGTVMAYAAFGNPYKYYNEIRNLLEKHYHQVVSSPEGMKRGVYVPPEEEVVHLALNRYRLLAEDEQEKYNIAATLQRLTDEFFTDIVKIAKEEGNKINFNSNNFCFSGGVSLNSSGIGNLWRNMDDRYKIYVPPVPYDGGLNIGATQYHYHVVLGNKKYYSESNYLSPYLGIDYSKEEIKETINNNIDKIEIVQQNGSNKTEIHTVAKLLSEGNIISIFNGKSESGRRALGNRSILADPRNPEMKDIINKKVKLREKVRPFAPSILDEYGNDWFEKYYYSPYMGNVFKFKKDKLEKIPAIIHKDGTGRLQSVRKKDNEWYYKLIKSFQNLTGIPIVLNTSYNVSTPIVESPQDAIDCFLGTNMDYLYFVETKILIKKK